MGELADLINQQNNIEKLLQQINKLETQITKMETTSEEHNREKRRMKRQLGALSEENKKLNDKLQKIFDTTHKIPAPPKWLKHKKRHKKGSATPCLLLSDLHLDEVVEPATVEGVNEYNREIAHKRFDNIINRTVDVTKTYVNNLHFDGIVVMLGGDILTGDIHDELTATNETTVADSIVHWTPKIGAAIEYLASEFGGAYVPCVRGNHDRNSKQKQHKNSSQEALTWIIYNWLQDNFKNNRNITVCPSPSSDFPFNIYNKKFLLTHGDQFTGGGGMGGISGPVKRGQIKKQMRNATINKHFDYMVLGHFHQLTWGNGFVINGSLKGYDEYAYDHNFEYEPPQQAFWIVTPENGVTIQMPIFAD